MDKSFWAESLLAAACGRKRATEIVGDLLEVRNGQMTFGFWLALLRVTLAFAWRALAGVLLAGCLLVLNLMVFAKFSSAPRFPFGERGWLSLQLSLTTLFPCVYTCCFAAMMTLRSGVRNTYAGVSMFCTAGLMGSTYTYGFLEMRLVLVGAGILMMLASSSLFKKWRRPIALYAGVLSLTLLMFGGLAFIFSGLVAWEAQHGLMSSGEQVTAVAANRPILALVFGLPLLLQSSLVGRWHGAWRVPGAQA